MVKFLKIQPAPHKKTNQLTLGKLLLLQNVFNGIRLLLPLTTLMWIKYTITYTHIVYYKNIIHSLG